IGVTDNFFEVGGDSLLALKTVYRISKENFTKKYSIQYLYTYKNIQNICNVLSTIKSSHIYPLNSSTKKDILFCLHPAYGISLAYKNIAQVLSEKCAVFAVDSPVFHGIFNEVATPDEIINFYADSIENHVSDTRSCTLLSWSIGSIYVHAIREELTKRNFLISRAIFLDPYIPNIPYEKNTFELNYELNKDVINFLHSHNIEINKDDIFDYLSKIFFVNEKIKSYVGDIIFQSGDIVVISDEYKINNNMHQKCNSEIYKLSQSSHEDIIHDERLEFLKKKLT
ncbi:hypothetical protein AD948_00290, partial [Acetobacter senegalensis]